MPSQVLCSMRYFPVYWLTGLLWLSPLPPVIAQTQLINDGVVAGSILSPGEQDEYEFSVTPNESVHIRVVDTNQDEFVLDVQLFNPDNSLEETEIAATVAEFDCYSTSSQCRLEQSGTYRLLVGDREGTRNGDYEIFFARIVESNELGQLVNDASVTGAIDRLGDLDTYVFDVAPNEAAHIRIADTGQDEFYVEAYLYNPDGTLEEYEIGTSVAELDCFSTSSQCRLDQAGRYRLLIADRDNNPFAPGNYEIFFTRIVESNELGQLVNDASVTGAIDRLGDLDTYVFDVAPNEAAHIRIADTGQDEFYVEAYLYNPDGTLEEYEIGTSVAELDCFSTSSQCRLDQAGRYRLLIADRDNNPFAPGNYEIFFTRIVESNELGQLVNDASVTGAIDRLGDLDTYVFDVAPNEAAHIRIADTGQDEFYVEAYLYNPDGTLEEYEIGTSVAELDCFSTSSQCRLDQAGRYRLLIADRDNNPFAPGNYEIFFTRIVESNELGQLVNDASVTGAIDRLGDLDTYVFDVAPNEAAHIRIADTGQDEFYVEAYLYNPDGTLEQYEIGTSVAELDCFSTSSQCRLDQAGRYRLLIADRDNNPFAPGNYEIFFTRIAESNELGQLVNGGSITGAIDPLGDLDTFVFQASPGDAANIRIVDTRQDEFFVEAYLYNPDGTLEEYELDTSIAELDCSSTSFQCRLNQTGTYRLLIADRDNNPFAPGNYRVDFSGPQQVGIPGKAAAPNPGNGSAVLSSPIILSWSAAANATAYDVVFDGVLVSSNQAGLEWIVDRSLSAGSYTWRVDSRNSSGTTTGDTWSFTVTDRPSIDVLDLTCSEADCSGNYLTRNAGGVFATNDLSVLAEDVSVQRTGVLADGTTLLLLRSRSDNPLTFSISDLAGNTPPNSSPCQLGTLYSRNGTNQSCSSVTVEPEQTPMGPMAFAVYQAPSSIPASTQIRISLDGAGTIVQRFLDIEPPPVLLVHGLWSSRNAWRSEFLDNSGETFESVLVDAGYTVNLPDHSDIDGSAGSFDPSNSRIVRRLDWQIRSLLALVRASDTAGTRVDVVGHSLGGLIARSRINSTVVPYRRIDNLDAGDFRKLITIGTPHHGSSLADVLIANRCNTREVCSFRPFGEPECTQSTLESELRLIGRPLGPAALGLQTASPELRALTHNINVVHAIATTAPQDPDTESRLNFILSLASVNGTIDTILGGDRAHDTIVQLPSQIGGAGQLNSTQFANIVHANVELRRSDEAQTRSREIAEQVVRLLSEPTVFEFGDLTALPPGGNYNPPAECVVPRLAAKGSTSATIEITPDSGTVVPVGSVVPITFNVIGADGITGAILRVGSAFTVIEGNPPYAINYDVPAVEAGRIPVYAQTYGDGDQQFAAETSLLATLNDVPTQLRVSPEQLQLNPGDTFALDVVAQFANGDEVSANESILGTTYTTSPGTGGIVDIDPDGVVTAISVGEETLSVEIEGVSETVTVTVLPPTPESPLFGDGFE